MDKKYVTLMIGRSYDELTKVEFDLLYGGQKVRAEQADYVMTLVDELQSKLDRIKDILKQTKP